MCNNELPALGIHNSHGQAYGVFKVIIKVIKDALKRGETVDIDGLGTFSIRVRKATRHATGHNYLINQKGGVPLGWAVEEFPAKSYVHFKPHKDILRSLDAD